MVARRCLCSEGGVLSEVVGMGMAVSSVALFEEQLRGCEVSAGQFPDQSSWGSTLTGGTMSESYPQPLRNGTFLRSHAVGECHLAAIFYESTWRALPGTLRPVPCARLHPPWPCTGYGGAEAPVQPLRGPRSRGWSGSAGEPQDMEEASEKARILGAWVSAGSCISAHPRDQSPLQDPSSKDGCEAWEITWVWVFLGNPGQAACPGDGAPRMSGVMNSKRRAQSQAARRRLVTATRA